MTQVKARTSVRTRVAERPARPICHVCGQPVEDKIDATCRECSKPVHVSWAQGQPESACSQVVMLENCCGIGFVCNPCVQEKGLLS